MKKLLLSALVSVAFAAPTISFAESNNNLTAISGGTSTAAARLDFSVVVPGVLFLRVGTGGAVGAANDTTVDPLVFTVPPANLGDGTVVVGTGGDVGAGAVSVRVYSNVGTNVTLNSNVSGQLINGSGDTIPWTQIAVVPAALAATTAGYTNGAITHPTFSATSGNGTATTLTAASKLVRQEGKWTFSYSNAAVVPAGTYGATIAKNGRVTYTATQL